MHWIHVDSRYSKIATEMSVEVNTSNIVQNNEYQRNAIKKALKSTFTLIHGPPGMYANEKYKYQFKTGIHWECLKWRVCFAYAHSMLRQSLGSHFIRFFDIFSLLLYLHFTCILNHNSFMDTLQGTGKTYTGTKLVYIFNEINNRMQTEGRDKKQLVFCGPNNKSVDLVASKFFSHIRYQVRVIYWLICGRLYMLSLDQDDLGLSKVQLYHFSRIPFWFMWVSLRTRYWVSLNGDKKFEDYYFDDGEIISCYL